MKIVSLIAENVKKLRAVEIKPSGEIVTISGRNGQGKTSVLDSIWWALAGTANVQAKPIRNGQKKARIRLNLGELTVERKFTESGSTLAVESADGARYPSPQKMLDALLGELSFDPLSFARMEPRKQFDELRRVSKLNVDIDQLDGLNRADYAKRAEINRDAKAKRARADGIAVPDGLPETTTDEGAVLDKIQKAAQHNADIELRRDRRAQAQRDAADKKSAAAGLRQRAEKLREEAGKLDAEAATLVATAAGIEKKVAEAPALPPAVDVAELRAELESVKQINAHIGRRAARQSLVKEAEELESQSKAISERMDAREKEKRDAVAGADMPVAGLGFGEGVVTFNGVPFEQCSSAEQLRVSMAIAMAANPKLRVIRITDGSLLDADSLAEIGAMAKAQDYQVWIERVDSTGKVGITIEDGAVVAVDGESVPQKESA